MVGAADKRFYCGVEFASEDADVALIFECVVKDLDRAACAERGVEVDE